MAVKAVGEMAQFFGDKPNITPEGLVGYDNGCWQTVLDIPFLTRLEEAGLYKVIIRTLWLESTGWSKEIRNRYPHVIQLGLSDHPLSMHISKLSADKQGAYIDDLNYLDGIMALSEEEREWYSVAALSKPVVNVGLPFPYESYSKNFGKLIGNEKKYIGLGVGASDNDRNFISSVLAFQKLKLLNPELQGVFLSVPSQLIPYCSYWADRVEGIFIQQRSEMGDYLDILSQCKFVINLADRNTPGRLQGEAAFLGVPVIGSDRLELQRLLWPSFAVRPYELEQVVALGQMILDLKEHEERKDTWIRNAQRTLKETFDLEPSKAKFEKLLTLVKEAAH